MAELNGLLDGETAAALRALYPKVASATIEDSGSSSLAVDDDSWSTDGDSGDSDCYCDRCGEKLLEEEIRQSAGAEEDLCEDCDRRANTHAVERFSSIRSREKDLD